MSSNLTDEAKKLSVAERIVLVEEIWDSIAEDNGCFELSESQKEEIDRRLASFQANPSQGRSWDEIKAEFLNCKTDPRSTTKSHEEKFVLFSVI